MAQTGVMTPTEFLTARIAEDEAEAREAITQRQWVPLDPPVDADHSLVSWPNSPVPAVLVGPERVLAECEAKRRIVGSGAFPTREVKIIAAIYADHPDYDPAWRV